MKPGKTRIRRRAEFSRVSLFARDLEIAAMEYASAAGTSVSAPNKFRAARLGLFAKAQEFSSAVDGEE